MACNMDDNLHSRDRSVGLIPGLCICAVFSSCVFVAQTVKSDCKGASAAERIRQIKTGLEPDEVLAHELRGGRVGDGIRQPWMDLMKKEGIARVGVTIEFLWNADTRVLDANATTINYYRRYTSRQGEVDSPTDLERFLNEGLEQQLRIAALDVAREKMPEWMGASRGRLRGELTVILFDDECLPALGVWTTSNILDADETELMKAAMEGNVDRVRTLLISRPNLEAINVDGQTALMYAVLTENVEIVDYLISSGANVNAKDKHRETVLMKAAWKGESSLVDEIIKRGADVNAKGDRGQTALLLSVSPYNSPATAEVLVAVGAHVNDQDDHGRTALMTAVSLDLPEMVELLLGAHADVGLKDDEGQTALSIASHLGRTKILTLLRSAKTHDQH